MPQRILVVEDDLDTLVVLQLTFAAAGYDVQTTCTLADARTALAGTPPPDLVVLDLVLSGGDPLDLCHEARAAHPWLPVLGLAPAGSPEAAERAAEAGCRHVLTRPVEPGALEAAARRAMGDALERRRLPRAG